MKKVLFLLILVSSFLSASYFPYVGEIKNNNGDPIVGARVLSLKTGMETHTNEFGCFGGLTNSIIESVYNKGVLSPKFNKSTLYFSSTVAGEKVCVELFDLRGRLVFSHKANSTHIGINKIHFNSAMQIGNGVYIVSLRVGNMQFRFKELVSSKFLCNTQSFKPTKKDAESSKLRALVRGEDTLFINASGYSDTIIIPADTNVGLITLANSTTDNDIDFYDIELAYDSINFPRMRMDTVLLNISLKNGGTSSALAVSCSLATNDSTIEIINAISSYDTIAADNTIKCQTPYKMLIPRTFPAGQRIVFDLHISGSWGSSWSDRCSYMPYPFVISMDSIYDDDTPDSDGNNDKRINVGEVIEYIPQIHNISGNAITDIYAMFMSDTSFDVWTTNSIWSYGNIDSDKKQLPEDDYVFEVKNDIKKISGSYNSDMLVFCTTDGKSRRYLLPTELAGAGFGSPIISAQVDTFVHYPSGCAINVFADDTNAGGHIVKYYWDIGADGWDDSTDVATYTFTWSEAVINGGFMIMDVIWGAKDNDGIIVVDTFTIRFNRQPTASTVLAPTETDAWKSFDYTLKKGHLILSLSGTDPDGVNDTLNYKLWLSTDSLRWYNLYTGDDPRYTYHTRDVETKYYWKLTVTDMYYQRFTDVGSFTTPSQYIPSGMKLILAGGKTFSMGSNNWYPAEKPLHSVKFSDDFFMDSTEVTQKRYDDLMDATYRSYSTPRWTTEHGLGNNYPAYYVAWYVALLYCNAISKQQNLDTVYCYSTMKGYFTAFNIELMDLAIDLSKNGYRLPTEAQWEYACRAGNHNDYYWGSDSTNSSEYAWYKNNSENKTHIVATKLANQYGLHDMSGNVKEWCSDWYSDSYYNVSPSQDPLGPATGTSKVCRGGTIINPPSFIRSAKRGTGPPKSGVFKNNGFRTIRPAK